MSADETTFELAALLGDVFFELDGHAPIPSASGLARLDDAVADGLASLEQHFDAMGAELGVAVFVLLHDMRNGMVDRTSGRVTAEVLLRHVAATVGVASAEPLIRLLGALAVLPDGPETYSRALDPTPDPESCIEVAMAALVPDPGARGELRRVVHRGSLLVPVLDLGVADNSLSLQCLPVVVRGLPMISVFTSAERVAEHLAAAGICEVPLVAVDGGELSAICPPGHGVAINPGWVVGCVFEEIEVRCLPDAPGLLVPEGEVDLRPAAHPAIVGAIDGIRDDLVGLGVSDVVAACRGEDVVIAVVGCDGTTPEQAVRRVGVALARRGLEGPVVVPASSPIGRAVLAASR